MPSLALRSLCLSALASVACATAPVAPAPEAPHAANAAAEHGHGRAAEHGHGPEGHGSEGHGSEGHGHGYHKDFSDAQRFSTHFDDPARDAWQRPDEVLEHLRIRPGSVVVDLGAGTGYFVAALAARVGAAGKVLALDVEPEMVRFLERRVQQQHLANVEPRLVKPDDPGLPAAGVSRILVVNTWHHIDDRPAYARKLAAALEPGGELWVVDFSLDSDLGPPREHRLAPDQVVGELEQGGLHAEIVERESLPKQYLVRASLR